jgi:Right handed beta helix region
MARITLGFLVTLALAAMSPAMLPIMPANAQGAIRTFVSTTGSDSNPCSITSPCRHFSAAIGATAAGGEVDALEPGAYGSFSINKAITIEGQGWSYVAPPPDGQAIFIAAGANDDVNLSGLSLNGVGVANATGILFLSGASLNIQDSKIRNFSGAGVTFQPNTASQLFVSNTLIAGILSQQTGVGAEAISISASGSVDVGGTLDHVQIENSSGGMMITTEPNQTFELTISNTIIAKTGLSGFNSPGLLCQTTTDGGGTANIMIRESTIANNNQGLQSDASGCNIWITRSTISGNGSGWSLENGGKIVSYQDNNVTLNGGNGGGTPSSDSGYQ